MSTGKMPFQGKTLGAVVAAILHDTPEPPSKLNPDMPEALQQIIWKALEKDPDARYQTASDMGADLKRLKSDVESRKSHTGFFRFHGFRFRDLRFRGSQPRPVRLKIAYAVAVVIAMVALAYFSTRPSPQPRVSR